MKIKLKGLSEDEVLKSREQFGSNEVKQKERDTFWGKVLETIKEDRIIQLLFVALGVQIVFYFLGFTHWYEPFGIFIAVTLATLVGTWSELSSENQFQDLQDSASKILCKVLRDGTIKELPIGEIVKGDLVIIQTGDKIPADGVLVEGELKINQVSLNGENDPVTKLKCNTNFNFAGIEHDSEGSPLMNPYKLFRESVVEDGEAVLLVEHVGVNTMSGSLSAIDGEEIDSPLKAKLSVLADGISKFGYIGGVGIAIAFMLVKAFGFDDGGITSYFTMENISNIGPDIVNSIILAILIIVMAVPEGLPMMIAIVLSLNMKKLLKDNILVRKMVGIETAGSLNILFSDKTGTITEGKLKVVEVLSGNYDKYQDYDSIHPKLKEWIDISLSVNTNAAANIHEDGTVQIVGGNATEKALLHFVHDEVKSHDVEVIGVSHFNSTDKYMSSEVKGSHNCTLYKGAPEVILERCTKYFDPSGRVCVLNTKRLSNLNKEVNDYANRAMRIIAVSVKDTDDVNILVCLVAIRDDIKQSSKDAFQLMTDAGVQVVMVTGDRKETAVAIALEMGMLPKMHNVKEFSGVLTSQELTAMSDEEVKKIIPQLRVVARALPHDKLRLVTLAQELGLVVGMTGDGANDKPALEKADVGFSMGSGTEVAKEASDIVILDDSLEAISKTTLYGRTIYKSIQKFIQFQVTVSVGAILIALVGPFIGVDLPLSMTQILWMNLIMDTLAALALGGEPSLKRYMAELPKKRTEALVTKDMWSSIGTVGVFILLVSVWFLKSPDVASFFVDTKTLTTGFFLFFVMVNVFNLLNVRSKKFNLFEDIKANKYFIPVFCLILVLQLLMTFFGGDIMRAYGFTNPLQFFAVILLSSSVILVETIRKKIVAN